MEAVWRVPTGPPPLQQRQQQQRRQRRRQQQQQRQAAPKPCRRGLPRAQRREDAPEPPPAAPLVELDAVAALGPAGQAGSGAAAAGAAPSVASMAPPRSPRVDSEIFAMALPTLATLAADPLAGLVSTAWVGRLGAGELAAVGVALSVYGSLTKLINMPLLAVTTSTVAAALGAEADPEARAARVGTALSATLALALLVGLSQAALLGLAGQAGLALWGVPATSPLHGHALAYLSVRALAAPATTLFLALQGAFRGVGDTRAPLAAALVANGLNLVLEPVLIFWVGWGVPGAAAAVVAAQAVAAGGLLVALARRYPLRLGGRAALAGTLAYLRPTALLMVRTLAITSVYALGTSLAARTDAAHAAAHQIAFQVWLASSLLADSLAVAAQSLLAKYLAAGDRATARAVVGRTLQLALALGGVLALLLAAARGGLGGLFTTDAGVLAALGSLLPIVALTQPLNALAFLMDGVLYGCQGFQYAATAMAVACIPAGALMLLGARSAEAVLAGGASAGHAAEVQLQGVWVGLAALMAMRFVTLFVPLRAGAPPFDKLQEDRSPD